MPNTRLPSVARLPGGTTTARSSLWALLVLGLFLVGVLLTMPNLVKPRVTRSFAGCQCTLVWVAHVKRVWARETGRLDTDTPTASDLVPVLNRIPVRWNGRAIDWRPPTDGQGLPLCPHTQTNYVLGAAGAPPRCPAADDPSGWESLHAFDRAIYAENYGRW